jgi:molecular chaperone GrpE
VTIAKAKRTTTPRDKTRPNSKTLTKKMELEEELLSLKLESKKNETQLREEIQLLQGKLARLQEDLAGIQRRRIEEKAELESGAEARILSEIIPVIDSFHMALKNANVEDDWHNGIIQINRQLENVLEEMGLERIDALDEPFDPKYHQAIMTERAPGKVGIVLAELQTGYILHGKVLRAAMVKVGKNDFEE